MSNPIIVFRRIDTATLTASAGSDASYPLTNLQDGRWATQWMSGDTTDGQTLLIDFLAYRNCSSLLCANHNFSSLGCTSIKLQYDLDDNVGFVTPVDVVANLSISEPSFNQFVGANRRYWRLQFNKGSALTSAPKIGMIFLGNAANLPLFSNNPKRGLKGIITRDESLSGLSFASSPYSPRQTWKIDWGVLKSANNYDVWRWLNGVGIGLYPFWFKDIDDNWHFVRILQDSVEGNAKGNVIFDFKGLQFVEERVGVSIQLPGGYTV
jgi:hypothetical protein